MFSAHDLQTGRIMASGRNSKTRQECIEGLAEYLNSDSEEGDEIPATEKEVCSFEFEIIEHEDTIESED